MNKTTLSLFSFFAVWTGLLSPDSLAQPLPSGQNVICLGIYSGTTLNLQPLLSGRIPLPSPTLETAHQYAVQYLASDLSSLGGSLDEDDVLHYLQSRYTLVRSPEGSVRIRLKIFFQRLSSMMEFEFSFAQETDTIPTLGLMTKKSHGLSAHRKFNEPFPDPSIWANLPAETPVLEGQLPSR